MTGGAGGRADGRDAPRRSREAADAASTKPAAPALLAPAARSPAAEQATLPLAPLPQRRSRQPRLGPPHARPTRAASPLARRRRVAIPVDESRSLPPVDTPGVIAAAPRPPPGRCRCRCVPVPALGRDRRHAPRGSRIGPIALVVRADPDVTAPDPPPTRSGLLLEIPIQRPRRSTRRTSGWSRSRRPARSCSRASTRAPPTRSPGGASSPPKEASGSERPRSRHAAEGAGLPAQPIEPVVAAGRGRGGEAGTGGERPRQCDHGRPGGRGPRS